MQRMESIRQTIPGYSELLHYAFFKHLLACFRVKRLLILGVYHGRDVAYLSRKGRHLYHVTGCRISYKTLGY